MIVRATAAALVGSAAVAAALAPAAAAQARLSDWRYVAEYSSLAACQSQGRGLVARHQAREFFCQNTYTASGTPVLDLYVR